MVTSIGKRNCKTKRGEEKRNVLRNFAQRGIFAFLEVNSLFRLGCVQNQRETDDAKQLHQPVVQNVKRIRNH